ncbi:MAG: response regulator [Candidatus Sericytochromatia bacterium]|nr:response regulator [Candidatus Sericytochromatia bacterium]
MTFDMNDEDRFSESTPGEGPLFKERKILAVDDDPDMLVLITLVISKIVGHVYQTNFPREGLRLAITYKPDLIILDNDMPDMKGVEVLNNLRDMPNTRQTPVLMLTADNSEASVKKAIQHQASGYLLKPFNPVNLRDEVVKILAGLKP